MQAEAGPRPRRGSFQPARMTLDNGEQPQPATPQGEKEPGREEQDKQNNNHPLCPPHLRQNLSPFKQRASPSTATPKGGGGCLQETSRQRPPEVRLLPPAAFGGRP